MDMIIRFAKGLASRLRVAFYRARGMQIRGHVLLRAIEVGSRARGISLEDGAALDRGVVLLATSNAARIEIGKRGYINRGTMIDADELVSIGDETMIGPYCYITDHDHGMRVGTRPYENPLISVPTRIGARCWIGAHVTILKGVTIGDDTVIGAGCVVTKSVPPGVIAVGNPARVLKPIPA